MTIIIFSPKGIRPSKRNLFQLEKLEEEGFHIQIINASTLFKRKNLPPQKEIHENTVYFKTQFDVDNFSIEEKKVLFIVSDAHLNIASNVLSKIKRNQDVLLSYSNKTFAPVYQTKYPLKKFSQLLLSGLDKIFPLYFFKHYYKLKHKQLIPDYFLGSTEYLTPTKIQLTVKPKNRIFGHSDDFNEILQLDKYSDVSSRNCVFIDQAMPYQEIILEKNSDKFLSNSYMDEYYSNLNFWLIAIKKKYNIDDVVIALHPRSILFIDEIKKHLPDFELISGNTVKLIKESFIITGHFSAALGCSIYYEKPIILFEDKTILSETAWKEAISYFNTELGIPVIDMYSRNQENLNLDLKINTEAYKKYKTCYIKDNSIYENSYYHAIKKIQKLEF